MTHLSDVELAELLATEAGERASEHLQGCAECRDEFEAVRRAVKGLREFSETAGEREPWFWQRQAARVYSRTATLGNGWGWAALSSAAALVLAAMLMLNHDVPAPQRAQIDDQQLLVHIERTLESDISPSLAGTAMLLDEMTTNNSSAVMNSENKEKPYED